MSISGIELQSTYGVALHDSQFMRSSPVRECKSTYCSSLHRLPIQHLADRVLGPLPAAIQAESSGDALSRLPALPVSDTNPTCTP